MERKWIEEPTPSHPEILAPAGDTSCFLSALAAGADNIYLGLKNFSARMQAENFGLTELSKLTDLAHSEDVRVTVAMNTLLKNSELTSAMRLISRLETQVGCDGLIVQDLAMLDLARQAGFQGSITLSTLANLTHPAALQVAKDLGANRVVLPRELSIEEIKQMAESCPEGIELECFIHGALCYCVSGRCYWSSYMGGKSGLRGRCVQPCRRLYALEPNQNKDERSSKKPKRGFAGRLFSCQDLSLDVLVKTLLGVPHLVSWKIEGRKKGPHYVYHTVKAYQILRDNPTDPEAKKVAQDYLDMSLGRPTTKARFLPQRQHVPVDPSGQTSSGLLVGKIALDNGRPFIKPHIPLLAKDYLRVGVEDEHWHSTLPVLRPVPKAGTFYLSLPKFKTPKAGVPVYLIDRREHDLMRLINQWQKRLDSLPARQTQAVELSLAKQAPPASKKCFLSNMVVHPSLPKGKETRGSRKNLSCLWLTARSAELSRTVVPRFGWWLPPVIWPGEEPKFNWMIKNVWRNGARIFVCNAPWQHKFFTDAMRQDPELQLVAGPFCNIANTQIVQVLMQLGFSAAIVSPELNRETFLELPKQSPLPLGLVLAGNWPVGISRFGTLGVHSNEPFSSPKGEIFWLRQYGENVWLYPEWQLNFTSVRHELDKAGYRFYVTMYENEPQSLQHKDRPGLFNWENALL